MHKFWEKLFDGGAVWGMEPCESAIKIAEEFAKKDYTNILIPGFGYGRNLKPFVEKNIFVTAIEISKSAIIYARSFGINIPIYNASVLDMPLDNVLYDGIYCYALLHLFNKEDRQIFIKSCFNQLRVNGEMVFLVVSPENEMFGKGIELGENYFKIVNGLNVFFYTEKLIESEFKNFGLIDYYKINEPIKHLTNEPDLNFYLVKCKKVV